MIVRNSSNDAFTLVTCDCTRHRVSKKDEYVEEKQSGGVGHDCGRILSSIVENHSQQDSDYDVSNNSELCKELKIDDLSNYFKTTRRKSGKSYKISSGGSQRSSQQDGELLPLGNWVA